MRVLHVITGLPLGGAETLLYRLATRSSGVEHEVIALAGRDWYSSRLEEHGIVVHHLYASSAASLPGAVKRLNRLIRQSRADVVQCWLYASNVVAGACARRAGIPVIWGIHSSSLGIVGRATRMLAYAGGLAARWIPDFIINCSAKSAEMHARMGYASAPGAVIFNGYDPEAFAPDEGSRVAMRRELEIDPATFLAASIGRWSAQKDFPNLLSAVRKAADRGVPIRCLLVGPGLSPDNAELMEQVRAAGCGELAVPLGPRADVQALARAIDVHVLASVGGEAFPNVVAETMLSGAPNIVTDVGDSAFMVADSGWVVPTSDSDRLADAIEQAHREWSGSPEQWNRRRAAARERIADNFTFERMAEAYEDIWRRFAKPSSASTAKRIRI